MVSPPSAGTVIGRRADNQTVVADGRGGTTVVPTSSVSPITSRSSGASLASSRDTTVEIISTPATKVSAPIINENQPTIPVPSGGVGGGERVAGPAIPRGAFGGGGGGGTTTVLPPVTFPDNGSGSVEYNIPTSGPVTSKVTGDVSLYYSPAQYAVYYPGTAPDASGKYSPSGYYTTTGQFYPDVGGTNFFPKGFQQGTLVNEGEGKIGITSLARQSEVTSNNGVAFTDDGRPYNPTTGQLIDVASKGPTFRERFASSIAPSNIFENNIPFLEYLSVPAKALNFLSAEAQEAFLSSEFNRAMNDKNYQLYQPEASARIVGAVVGGAPYAIPLVGEGLLVSSAENSLTSATKWSDLVTPAVELSAAALGVRFATPKVVTTFVSNAADRTVATAIRATDRVGEVVKDLIPERSLSTTYGYLGAPKYEVLNELTYPVRTTVKTVYQSVAPIAKDFGESLGVLGRTVSGTAKEAAMIRLTKIEADIAGVAKGIYNPIRERVVGSYQQVSSILGDFGESLGVLGRTTTGTARQYGKIYLTRLEANIAGIAKDIYYPVKERAVGSYQQVSYIAKDFGESLGVLGRTTKETAGGLKESYLAARLRRQTLMDIDISEAVQKYGSIYSEPGLFRTIKDKAISLQDKAIEDYIFEQQLAELRYTKVKADIIGAAKNVYQPFFEKLTYAGAKANEYVYQPMKNIFGGLKESYLASKLRAETLQNIDIAEAAQKYGGVEFTPGKQGLFKRYIEAVRLARDKRILQDYIIRSTLNLEERGTPVVFSFEESVPDKVITKLSQQQDKPIEMTITGSGNQVLVALQEAPLIVGGEGALKSEFVGQGIYERAMFTSSILPAVGLTLSGFVKADINTRLNLATNVNQRLNTNQSDIQAVRNLTNLRTNELSLNRLNEVEQNIFRDRSAEQERQQERLNERQLQRLRSEEELIGEEGYRFGLPKLLERKKNKERMKRRQSPAYSVFLRRRGKYLPFATGLPRGLALMAGQRAALGSIGRTAKLVEFGTTDIPDVDGFVNQNIFRQYTVRKGKQFFNPNILVQRQRAAITTPEEKYQLAEARRQAKILKGIF